MFKRHNFKTIRCNRNDPEFYINQFVGKINLCISKLRKKKKAVNEVINKIAVKTVKK